MSSRGPVRSISLVRPRGPITIRKFIPREPLGCVNGESDTIAVASPAASLRRVTDSRDYAPTTLHLANKTTVCTLSLNNDGSD